jgi:dTDP-4-dehydrorhamnose reductase
MRFVVTGANGLVGSRLVSLLASRGHWVLALSRGESRLPRLSGETGYRSVELADGALVRQLLEQAQPDVMVHTASMTEVDACERNVEQAYATNVRATEHLATAARHLGCGLLHVSTDYVFDGEAGPYSEEDAPNPRGVYATTKHIGEQIVRTLAPEWAIARTAVVFGWPPAGRPNFGSWLVSALSQGQRVNLFEDQHVSPSLADNVAEMIGEMAERRLTGVWNVCGASVVDRVTFGRALCRVFGLDPELINVTRLKDAKLASPRPQRSGLKTDKVQRELATRPLLLEDALKRFLEAYRASPPLHGKAQTER